MNISIIIPVYHVAPYVRRCLDSVMSQDVTGIDVECIIVDDCGQDESMAIVRQTIAGYQGPVSFRIVVHEKNRGLSAARNTGVEHAVGDFVLFIDSDDWLMPDALAKMSQTLLLHPDAQLVMGRFYSGQHQRAFHYPEEQVCLSDSVAMRRQLYAGYLVSYAWAKLVRRQILTDHSLAFYEGIIYEDTLWTYRLLHAIDHMVLIPDLVYYYEFNDTSITHQSGHHPEKTVKSFIVTCNELLDEPDEQLFADFVMYVLSVLLRAVDIERSHELTAETKADLNALKHRLSVMVADRHHGLLSILLKLMYPPYSHLMGWGFFRRHYHQLSQLVLRITR